MKTKNQVAKEAIVLSKLAPAMMALIIRVVNQSAIEDIIGFTQEQIKLLMIINYSGPVRLSFLTKQAGVTQGSMTVMVQRLIRKKMLNKSVDPTDKRAVIIHLTQQGKAYCQKINNHFIGLFDEICQGLNQEERQGFVKSYEVLVKVYKNFLVNKSVQEAKKREQGLPELFPLGILSK